MITITVSLLANKFNVQSVLQNSYIFHEALCKLKNTQVESAKTSNIYTKGWSQILKTYTYVHIIVHALNMNVSSVVPRRHCGIPEILPPMSLKNAPSAGLRVHIQNLLIFSQFTTISVLSVT